MYVCMYTYKCMHNCYMFICDVHQTVSICSHIIGVCLGMQVAVIEFARNVLGWKGKLVHALYNATPLKGHPELHRHLIV